MVQERVLKKGGNKRIQQKKEEKTVNFRENFQQRHNHAQLPRISIQDNINDNSHAYCLFKCGECHLKLAVYCGFKHLIVKRKQ